MKNLSKIGILFKVFFGISTVALGGGLTMLPIMSREFVDKRHWMSDDDMLDTVAVMQSLPGIISINMAVLIGYRIAGLAGAVASVLGVVLPPFLAILVIAIFLTHLDDNATMGHIFLGVRAAVAALILLSVIKMSKQVLTTRLAQSIATVGFIAMVFLNVNAILLVVFGGGVGLLLAYGPLLFRRRRHEEPHP